MRSLFTLLTMVSVVLVPWSSLAPALLSDASGSAIGSGASKSKGPAARLSPALGILPLLAQDEGSESFNDSLGQSPHRSPSEAPHTRMICENGVCRLVPDADPLAPNGWAHENATLNAKREKLEEIGATQVRVEFDSGGQWRCSCSVPVSPGSKVMRRFEGTGNTDEQAVQEACRVVESWLRDHR
jgi:hypothetical protein